MKASLWLFAYQGLSVATHGAIVQEVVAWPELGHYVKAGDAMISRARSQVASLFLQDKDAGDILLMVDSDMAWQAGDLRYIANRAAVNDAVVGVVYPKRAFGKGPALRLKRGVTKEGTYYLGEEALLEVEFVGTGFIAIPRTVLEKLSERMPVVAGDFWPFFMPYVIDGQAGLEFPNEDYAFCRQAQEVGCPIFVTTKPIVTHEGTYMFRMADAQVAPPVAERVPLVVEEAVPV